MVDTAHAGQESNKCGSDVGGGGHGQLEEVAVGVREAVLEEVVRQTGRRVQEPKNAGAAQDLAVGLVGQEGTKRSPQFLVEYHLEGRIGLAVLCKEAEEKAEMEGQAVVLNQNQQLVNPLIGGVGEDGGVGVEGLKVGVAGKEEVGESQVQLEREGIERHLAVDASYSRR